MTFLQHLYDEHPSFRAHITPLSARRCGLPAFKRAILILSDGQRTAEDISRMLHRDFNEVANALFSLYHSGLVEINLVGGASDDRRSPDAHRTAETPSAGFRPYQPAGGRSVRGGSQRSLFAA